MCKTQWGEGREPVPKPKTETEVVAEPSNDRQQRRKFAEEYKARILREADACTQRGALGALLRSEGLYSSQLSAWRAQAEREGLAGLQAKRPGPKPKTDDKDRVIDAQNRRIAKLEKELRISKALLELQGKAQEILGMALPGIDDNDPSADSSSSSNSATKRSR